MKYKYHFLPVATIVFRTNTICLNRLLPHTNHRYRCRYYPSDACQISGIASSILTQKKSTVKAGLVLKQGKRLV